VAALDDPQTRTALAGLRMGAVRWLGGGVIAVVLGLLLAAAAIRIAEDTGQPVPGAGLLVIALVLGGAAAAVAGLGSLVRARRWTAALACSPWRLGRLRVVGTAVLAIEPLGFDELGDEPLRLQLMSTAIWRTRAVQRMADGDVSYAPVSAREWVLTADGDPSVYGARVPRRGR
jgi:hypothetical protein